MAAMLTKLLGGGGPTPDPGAALGTPGSGLGALVSSLFGHAEPAPGAAPAPAAAPSPAGLIGSLFSCLNKPVSSRRSN